MSDGSFSKGVGEWVGSAEVYRADGRFAGSGRDTRSVKAEDGAGRVTVEVTFEGPFSLSGTYTIADHGSHRVYEGPLNHGYAEALGDGLVAAHNYWPDLGLSQRFFLMVLPDGTRQLSLALLNRGERLQWVVVGEYNRQLDPTDPVPAPATGDPAAERGRPRRGSPYLRDALAEPGDPAAERGRPLLLRAGCWSGRLHRLDADLVPAGMIEHSETVASPEDAVNPPGGNQLGGAANWEQPVGQGGDSQAIEMTGLGFASDASFTLVSNGLEVWTPVGDVVGSAILGGGRGLSGHFHHMADGLRVWRREVASLDGVLKAVLYLWYRGEQRLGAVYGTLQFDPA